MVIMTANSRGGGGYDLDKIYITPQMLLKTNCFCLKDESFRIHFSNLTLIISTTPTKSQKTKKKSHENSTKISSFTLPREESSSINIMIVSLQKAKIMFVSSQRKKRAPL